MWSNWEDWRAGLYAPTVTDEQVADSARLLANPDHFLEVARELLREWPNAATHNLIHMWTGRRAWIGQASCMYAHGATAASTRVAWGHLTNGQQRIANTIADQVHDEWKVTGAQVLF